MNKIGFIGAGSMGFAMLQGLLNQGYGESLLFTTLSKETKNRVYEKLQIPYAESNIDVVLKSKYIILAIKPQNYKEVMLEIKPLLTQDQIIISVTPGFTIEIMKEYLGNEVRIVRSMPNTPVLVGEGMSILSFSKDSFSNSEILEIKNLFTSFGDVEVLEENLMDAVVPISGSSPAYVYMMIEAMADGGVLVGLPRKLSYKLAAQSILGAAKMVLETEVHPGELKDAVCSPGGATIEAVAILEKRNFRNAIIEAMVSAYEKTKKLT